jgi:hypothetical protein
VELKCNFSDTREGKLDLYYETYGVTEGEGDDVVVVSCGVAGDGVDSVALNNRDQ